MTRPDFTAMAADIVSLVRNHDNVALAIVAMKIELAYEMGRGQGLDESNDTLVAALAKLGAKI